MNRAAGGDAGSPPSSVGREAFYLLTVGGEVAGATWVRVVSALEWKPGMIGAVARLLRLQASEQVEYVEVQFAYGSSSSEVLDRDEVIAGPPPDADDWFNCDGDTFEVENADKRVEYLMRSVDESDREVVLRWFRQN